MALKNLITIILFVQAISAQAMGKRPAGAPPICNTKIDLVLSCSNPSLCGIVDSVINVVLTDPSKNYSDVATAAGSLDQVVPVSSFGPLANDILIMAVADGTYLGPCSLKISTMEIKNQQATTNQIEVFNSTGECGPLMKQYQDSFRASLPSCSPSADKN